MILRRLCFDSFLEKKSSCIGFVISRVAPAKFSVAVAQQHVSRGRSSGVLVKHASFLGVMAVSSKKQTSSWKQSVTPCPVLSKSFTSPSNVQHEIVAQPMDTTSGGWRMVEGKKINVLSIKDFADGMLFVNAKKGFSLQYLQYHEELVFRGHLSTRAIEHAYNEVFGDEDDQVVTDFRKLHQTAMFYHLALQEFEVLGLHMTLVLDDEVTD